MRAIRFFLLSLLSVVCLAISCSFAWSQDKVHMMPDAPSTKLYKIVTDRSVYVAGESIWFRIFIHGSDSLGDLAWSKVYHMELVSPDGIPHARVKLPLDSSGAWGAISVPENLSSGNYFLKGYTQWMRNDGPATYTYLSVEIVNPNIKSVLQVDTSSEFSISVRKQEAAERNNCAVACNIDGELKFRKPINLYLKTEKGVGLLDCCISVVPNGSSSSQFETSPRKVSIGRNKFEHLPETRDVSLAGQVDFIESDMPASYAVVYVSRMGNKREFYCDFTDSTGRFHFAFQDQVGEQDLFISADHRLKGELRVSIEKDFCEESISLPSFPLEISIGRLDLFTQMAHNLDIRNQFYPSDPGMEDANLPPNNFFYGQPVSTVHFDDFIRLPTIREYFSELTPLVSIRKSERGTRLQVQGDHPDLRVFSPLIMMDGIAISDVESVMAVSPGLIDRIEIIDAPYIRGNITFGGIINLISRNDDMALIDLPDSGLLLHYQMLASNRIYPQDSVPADLHLPDVRNTLYWNPQVKLNSTTETVIQFLSPDSEGEFQVILRGYNARGSYIEERIALMVE